MSVQILIGDMRERLRELPDNSVDSCVCDPPYHLTSIVKRFGAENAAPAQVGKTGAYARASKGFMGQTWDGGDVAFQAETWAEVLRVLKPGGHLVAFSGTRTYHRMAVAIEDAGFEVRDMIAWHYGSGFPKSHDISKAIDRAGPPGQAPFAEFAAHYEDRRKALGMSHAQVCAAGGWHGAVNHGGSSVNWANGYGMPTTDQWAQLQPLLGLDDRWSERVQRIQYEREVLGVKHGSKLAVAPGQDNDRSKTALELTAAGSDAAREWEGWGTALKPATEPICLARKPLSEKSIAANVLKWGTGALNIDATRIGMSDEDADFIRKTARPNSAGKAHEGSVMNRPTAPVHPQGRWPANLCHDGSDEVVAGFPAEMGGGSFSSGSSRQPRQGRAQYGDMEQSHLGIDNYGDSGSAARFFYCAKAATDERGEGNNHPTVKPIALMRWLVRLVTPKGGTVLDPFTGSGSTLIAADAEQFNAIGCELSPEYAAIAERRIRDAAGMFANVTVDRSTPPPATEAA